MASQTIVVLYGRKMNALAEWIKTIQGLISGVVGTQFKKYEVEQVHATLVGLESDPDDSIYNRNFKMKRGLDGTEMDIDGYRQYLRGSCEFPFQVQIGGFKPRDYPFASRGQRPFERSFSIQGDKAVILGWPVRGIPLDDSYVSRFTLVQESRLYPGTLDGLRRHAQRYGILHAYHGALSDVDNDFYLRVGLFPNQKPAPSTAKEVEHTLRHHLSSEPPSILNVDVCDVRVASYEDEELPLDSTTTEPI